MATETSVHEKIRFNFWVATAMPSETVGSPPRSRRSAMTVTTTLQYVVTTDPSHSTGNANR